MSGNLYPKFKLKRLVLFGLMMVETIDLCRSYLFMSLVSFSLNILLTVFSKFQELLDLGEAVGTQSRGLSQEQISLLPVSKYKCSFFSRKKSRDER